MLLLVAGLTALISVNGAVAALLPMVVIVAIRTQTPTSKILMPLAFGAHAGSLLALTGTPVNVLVSEAAEDAGAKGFGYVEFALVGIPLVVGTITIVALFGNHLLPDRRPRSSRAPGPSWTTTSAWTPTCSSSTSPRRSGARRCRSASGRPRPS